MNKDKLNNSLSDLKNKQTPIKKNLKLSNERKVQKMYLMENNKTLRKSQRLVLGFSNETVTNIN